MSRRLHWSTGVAAAISLAAPDLADAQCRYQSLHHPEFLAGAQFGSVLAIDGSTAAVGQPGRLESVVHVFERGALDWQPAQTLELGHLSARAVSVQGDTLFAHDRGAVHGYDSIRVFERQAGTWIPTGLLPAPAAASYECSTSSSGSATRTRRPRRT